MGGTEWKGLFSKDPKHPIAWPGSGGGFDIQFAAPDYQKNTVSKYLSSTSGLPPASSFNASGKAYPDLSAVAIEGTSQSSPSMAGIWTLIMVSSSFSVQTKTVNCGEYRERRIAIDLWIFLNGCYVGAFFASVVQCLAIADWGWLLGCAAKQWVATAGIYWTAVVESERRASRRSIRGCHFRQHQGHMLWSSL